jgi:hypothetical protein
MSLIKNAEDDHKPEAPSPNKVCSCALQASGHDCNIVLEHIARYTVRRMCEWGSQARCVGAGVAELNCETIPDHSTEQKPANTGTHSKRILCVYRAKASRKRVLHSTVLPYSERLQ